MKSNLRYHLPQNPIHKIQSVDIGGWAPKLPLNPPRSTNIHLCRPGFVSCSPKNSPINRKNIHKMQCVRVFKKGEMVLWLVGHRSQLNWEYTNINSRSIIFKLSGSDPSLDSNVVFLFSHVLWMSMKMNEKCFVGKGGSTINTKRRKRQCEWLNKGLINYGMNIKLFMCKLD